METSDGDRRSFRTTGAERRPGAPRLRGVSQRLQRLVESLVCLRDVSEFNRSPGKQERVEVRLDSEADLTRLEAAEPPLPGKDDYLATLAALEPDAGSPGDT